LAVPQLPNDMLQLRQSAVKTGLLKDSSRTRFEDADFCAIFVP